MKFFIDTANLEEIREISSWGVVDGVTTNPSLIAKEEGDFKELIAEIAGLVDGPISAEVIGLDTESMLEEARELRKIHNNIVVKIPMTEEGLKAVSILSKEGIRTNVTLIFSASQALLAARAGASYVSPFIGRLDDIGHDGIELIRDIREIFNNYDIETEIIAASIRNQKHVLDSSRAGSDIGTIPYNVFKAMLKHPLTDSGIEKFMDDWKNRK